MEELTELDDVKDIDEYIKHDRTDDNLCNRLDDDDYLCEKIEKLNQCMVKASKSKKIDHVDLSIDIMFSDDNFKLLCSNASPKDMYRNYLKK
jgi:hypothetical protein